MHHHTSHHQSFLPWFKSFFVLWKAKHFIKYRKHFLHNSLTFVMRCISSFHECVCVCCLQEYTIWWIANFKVLTVSPHCPLLASVKTSHCCEETGSKNRSCFVLSWEDLYKTWKWVGKNVSVQFYNVLYALASCANWFSVCSTLLMPRVKMRHVKDLQVTTTTSCCPVRWPIHRHSAGIRRLSQGCSV